MIDQHEYVVRSHIDERLRQATVRRFRAGSRRRALLGRRGSVRADQSA